MDNLVNIVYSFMFGGRDMAYDDSEKNNNRGIYRVKFEDKNDLNKKGEPKIKFKYYYIKNNKEVDNDTLIRINKLGLAPAYINVWVSENPYSKIQATGIDAKGRKQYRYHPNAIEISTENKFLRLYKFIKAMPKLDNKIEEDIKLTMYSKNRVIAYMLKIVKELNMRVGKEHYAQTNKSYGISSLKKTHVNITDDLTIKFNFKAKSNKLVSYTLKDDIIANELKLLLQLEGEKLFQYISQTNNIIKVNDTDMNQYIQNYIGSSFTMKDYRTYAANLYFIKALINETKKRTPKDKKTIKKNLNLAQESTAFHLRHTKSISKKSYTMGLIRDMYEQNPQWFINNKLKKPLTILIGLLKIYKEKITKIRTDKNITDNTIIEDDTIDDIDNDITDD